METKLMLCATVRDIGQKRERCIPQTISGLNLECIRAHKKRNSPAVPRAIQSEIYQINSIIAWRKLQEPGSSSSVCGTTYPQGTNVLNSLFIIGSFYNLLNSPFYLLVLHGSWGVSALRTPRFSGWTIFINLKLQSWLESTAMREKSIEAAPKNFPVT